MDSFPDKKGTTYSLGTYEVWGLQVPITTNNMTSISSWGCSTADDLKDKSQYHRLLGLQEFQVPRPAHHPVKEPLPNCEKCFAGAF